MSSQLLRLAIENQLILGTPWQRKYKAYIHWAENQVFYIVEHRVTAIEFSSIEDFEIRSGAGKSTVALLKACGAFGDLPDSDQISLFGF